MTKPSSSSKAQQQGAAAAARRSSRKAESEDIMKLKDLKKGQYFCLRPHHEEEVTAKQVYIKGDYDRSTKRYNVGRCEDISYNRQLKGCMDVYLDFTY